MGETIKTVVDLIKLTPFRPLDGEIPKEVWYIKKVSFNHLRVFECIAFVHISKDESKNLDVKTKE